MRKIVIIGGGAAGLTAAGIAMKHGAQVTVIEKNEKPGRKLMITGKGRCNVTNNLSDLQALIAHVPTNGRFLYSAFSAFMPGDTMALFESLGVPLKTERGNRVFPVSDKAVDIVDALTRFAGGAHFVHGTVERLRSENGRIVAAVIAGGEEITGDCFILATGGASYPLTGSTGDGYRMAKMLGHSITPIHPSLTALKSPNGFCPRLQGLSLKNVRLSLFRNDKKKSLYSELGEMLFTHFGISGPLVLSASAYIRDFSKGPFYCLLDLKPGLTAEQLERRLLRDFEKYANKDFSNALGDLFPKKLIPVLVSLSGIEPTTKVNQITREHRLALIELIKSFRIDVNGFWSIEQAVITSGGVSVKEVEPQSMRSKFYPNLYFAGEVLDVDAFTGGFNLQIAFSTAYSAANAACE